MSTASLPAELTALMAAARAARGVEFATLDTGGLEACVVELASIVAVAQAVQVEAVHALNERGSWSADGSKNAATWLATHSHVNGGAASALVKLGRQLEEMPHTKAAFAAGLLSMRQAQTIAAVRDVDGFAEEEAALVANVMNRPADRTNEIVDRWRNHHQDQGVAADTRRRAGRSVTLTMNTDGMTVLHAYLHPEAGTKLKWALQRIAAIDWRASAPDDDRTFLQRQADALEQMAERAVATIGKEAKYPEPEVMLVVNIDYDTLVAGIGSARDVRFGQELTAEAARRLACDAGICRHITKGESVTMEMGRKARIATPQQRIAIATRDRHCRFPKCNAPPPWCQVHHLDDWIRHGDTDTERMILLCHHHHYLVHEGGWSIHRDPDGIIHTTAPQHDREMVAA